MKQTMPRFGFAITTTLQKTISPSTNRGGTPFLLSLVCAVSVSTAQIIPIKTVPLATGSQFSIFPSAHMASGGVSIATDDELLDPFLNPAKGYSVEGLRVLSAPQMYSVSMERGTGEGSGRSLPLGVLMKNGDIFGGLYWARQELSTDQNERFGVSPTIFANPALTPNDPENNTYTFAMLGTFIPGMDISIGASAMWGELNSVEGVNLLFPRSPKVLQNGSLSQFRLGLTRAMEDDQQFDAVLVRSVFKMRYDVGSSTTPMDGRMVQLVQFNPEYDQTNLWGLQLRYTRPLADNLRFGALLTTNWKEHPKIPNYDLMSIPRDPGNSTAYNLGLGLHKGIDYSYLAVDLIYEPITTMTWADANQPIPLSNGDIFPAGMRTVENFFNFSNWIGRIGFRAGTTASAFQAGLQVHAISYDLEQINHIQQSKRNQSEDWAEWTISAGYGFSVGPARVLYTGLLTMGTGQPGVVSAGWSGTARSGVTDAFSMGDFLPAPSGSLNVRDALIWTHMVSISYRIE